MRSIRKLIDESTKYSEAYAEKYDVEDEELVAVIREQHLAHLINQEIYDFGDLDEYFKNEEYHLITERLVDYLEDTFTFRPAWSDFHEIVVEYLSDGWVSDPVDYLTARYKLRRYETELVVQVLKKFSKYVG